MHDYYHLWNISIWIEKIGFFNENNNSLKYYLLSLPLGTNTEKSMNYLEFQNEIQTTAKIQFKNKIEKNIKEF